MADKFTQAPGGAAALRGDGAAAARDPQAAQGQQVAANQAAAPKQAVPHGQATAVQGQPAGQLQAGQAPAGQPPAGQAPAGQPPAGQAPARQPSAGQATAAQPSAPQGDRFLVTSPPHISGGITTRRVMLDVIIALMPATLAGAWFFGARVLLVAAATILASVCAEYVSRRAMKRESTVGDLSAVVTGLLLALNLPPSIEIWKAVVGGAIAIVLVKQIFGGIGQNFMNPALTARVMLLVSWGASMTRWSAPGWAFSPAAGVDAVSSATPLALAKAYFQTGAAGGLPQYASLFAGSVAGCIGETSAAALLVGGAYLIAKKVISWHIPLAYIATAALASWAFGGAGGKLFGGDPLYHVLSGGLLLGAIFMATDYSTSPMTKAGKLIMGVGCGLLTTVIRLYTGYPEGVSFSILIMNVLTPLIDKYTVPRPFGAQPGKGGFLRRA